MKRKRKGKSVAPGIRIKEFQRRQVKGLNKPAHGFEINIDDKLAERIGILEPGWTGLVLRVHAEGAYPNGTRIVKCNSEPKDQNSDGSSGTVLGSVDTELGYLYFIEWDTMPKVSITVMARKVRPCDN